VVLDVPQTVRSAVYTSREHRPDPAIMVSGMMRTFGALNVAL
jgi:hypothetical protein